MSLSYPFLAQEELERILSNINTWGLDVFTANSIIRENRVLTCTTFRFFPSFPINMYSTKS